MEKEKSRKEKFKTISLQDVKAMLGFTGKGFRSVLRWCLKKRINVFGDGRRRRILETDWIETQQKDLIRAIKHQFPTTWSEELKKRGIKLKDLTTKVQAYQSQSNNAAQLLKDWDDE